MKKLNKQYSIIIAGELQPSKVYIGFSPAKANSQKYAKILDQGMKELRKNGKLMRILKNMGLVIGSKLDSKIIF